MGRSTRTVLDFLRGLVTLGVFVTRDFLPYKTSEELIKFPLFL